MSTDMGKLRARMADMKLSPEDVAREIGVNPSTFYRKIKSDGINFTVGQMHKIVDVLKLTREEAASIFLWHNSQ